MRDLRVSLQVMSERGTPMGSRRLREKVALKLAGSTGGVEVGDERQTTVSSRWWRRPAVAATAAVLGGLVLIGGTALLTFHLSGGDGTLDQVTGGVPKGYVSTTFTATGVLDSASGEVCCLAAAPDGIVWLGVPGLGLASFDGDDWTTYGEAEGVPGTVGSMDVAPDGTVWAGTSVWAPDGTHTTDSWVIGFDGEAWTTRGVLRDLPGGAVRVAAAPDGTVRAGFPAGYIGYMVPMPFEYFHGACGDSCETWFDQGLYFWGDIAVGPDGTVWGYAKSDSGVMGGLIRLTEAGFVLEGTGETGWVNDDGSRTPFRNLAVGADGTVWIATDTAAINRFDGETWITYPVTEGVPREAIPWVEAAADGRIWFGTATGLLSFDGRVWTWDPIGSITAFAAAPDGTLWAVMGEHLVRYTPVG